MRNQLADVHSAANTSTNQTDWSNGLLAINPDYAGWLTVYATDVDYPVVLGATNDTYLRHDFYGEYSEAGTLFLDETTDISTSGNRIIYGHKMNDGTMFASLESFKSGDFFKENGVVRWEDAFGTQYYKIFAVMVVPGQPDATGFIDLQQWNNRLPDTEATAMLATIEEKAFIHQSNWMQPDDTYLFLVTCDYTRDNGRLVLVGRSM